MNRTIYLFIIITFLTIAFSGIIFSTYAQIDTIENGVFDKYLRVQKVSDRVIIVGSGSNYYTAIIGIKTEKGLVAIDAGISPIMTARYRKTIEEEFGRNDFIYLINTHGHDDHTSGNQVFSDIPIIAHENCKTDMLEFWNDTAKVNMYVYNEDKRIKARQSLVELDSDTWKYYESLLQQNYTLKEVISEGGFKITYPTLTFSDRLTMDLGDITLQLIYFGKAHTTSDIMIYIPEEKILCIGDLFGKDGEPGFDVTNNEDAKRWYKVMDWLLEPDKQIEKILYGHGLILSKKDLISFKNNIR
jgi:cyclase